MRACAAAVTALLLLALPSTVTATQVASVSASFSPNRPGTHAAVTLGFRIKTLDGSLPSALTSIVFHYPRDLGLGTSELGLASCDPSTLEFAGPQACPRNSLMGRGNALAKFQVSPEISHEGASIALVAGPSNDGYLKILIGATAAYPVFTRIVMSTLLRPGRLEISVPLVPGIPEGPYIAVVAMKVTIGGALTYFAQQKGRRHAYRPQGILLPPRCPQGGFRFGADFSFLDGTTASAQTRVQCRPAHGARHAWGAAARNGGRHARVAAARSRGRDAAMPIAQ